MHPKHLSVKDFTYQLPEEKIARFPLADRDQSKLLIYKDHKITEDQYSNLAVHLPENALLVFNNTKVVEARLLFQKSTGGWIEIFTLEPHRKYSDISSAMKMKGKVWWNCLIGGAGKWKRGQILQKQIHLPGQDLDVQARIVERWPDQFTIEFCWHPDSLSFAEILHFAGVMPIPPYLKRESVLLDQERYQTIYASADGSVAAPTAGLHFTENVFEALKSRSIQTAFVTLHVGAGTFMPVKTETLEGHHMHAEFIDVDAAFIKRIAESTGDIFAVGTTSLRTLESLYWMGLKCYRQPLISPDEITIMQWEVYDELEKHAVSKKNALLALLNWMAAHSMERLIVKTQILIAPGYKPKIINGLITNFHQPNSTLLVLVAALIGNDWHKVYAYALSNQFRFLSYGDGCLLYLH